jgi:hypothetical protein
MGFLEGVRLPLSDDVTIPNSPKFFINFDALPLHAYFLVSSVLNLILALGAFLLLKETQNKFIKSDILVLLKDMTLSAGGILLASLSMLLTLLLFLDINIIIRKLGTALEILLGY